MIVAPHEHREPMRAIARPLQVQVGEPVVIVTKPWMAQIAVSVTRAIGRLLQVQFGDPWTIEPPCERLSITRAIAPI